MKLGNTGYIRDTIAIKAWTSGVNLLGEINKSSYCSLDSSYQPVPLKEYVFPSKDLVHSDDTDEYLVSMSVGFSTLAHNPF